MMLAFLLAAAVSAAAGSQNHLIYWNTTNPMFRLDNQDHVVDVNVGNMAAEYDQMHLICPNNPAEQHVIYSVSRQEYETCRVSNPRPKIVAVCNKPDYFTITFRSFSPTPGGLEFKPGQTYYLVSTSTARDLHRRAGGYCASHNMKMIFNVAEEAESIEAARQATVVTPPQVEPRFRSLRNFASSSTPVYEMPRLSRVKSSDYLYYYTPRDLLHLKRAVSKHMKSASAPKAENETWKAEKLTSASIITSAHSLIILTSCFLLLRYFL